MSALTLRPMTDGDLPVARHLLGQLGYDLPIEEVQRRFRSVEAAPGHAVLLGDRDGEVVALCHLFVRPALEKPPEVVVQALVVDEASRGTGAGQHMMQAAEDWAAARGFNSIALYSSITRHGTHAFYEAIGYVRSGTSHLFRKALT